MITSLYAGILSLVIIGLSLRIITFRQKYSAAIGDSDGDGDGDGGQSDIITARAAQENALNYIPLALLLMAGAEYSGVSAWLLHSLGLTILLGRLCHVKAILEDNIKLRTLAIHLTLWSVITLALLNSTLGLMPLLLR